MLLCGIQVFLVVTVKYDNQVKKEHDLNKIKFEEFLHIPIRIVVIVKLDMNSRCM